MSDGDFWVGVLTGAIMAGFLAFFIGVAMPSTETEKQQIVCEYEGGELKDDVCIKDGEVIDLK